MMFDFVQSIALNISWALSFVSKYDVFLLLVVFVLGDSKVHIYTIYSGNMTSDIEAIINEYFGRYTTLGILYINSDDSYIRF